MSESLFNAKWAVFSATYIMARTILWDDDDDDDDYTRPRLVGCYNATSLKQQSAGKIVITHHIDS
jgi:hypothetical protein